MSAPDPVSTAADHLPGDPAAYGRRRRLPAPYWAAMGFCALCLIASVVVVTLVPRLSAPKAAEPVTSAPVEPAEPVSRLQPYAGPTPTYETGGDVAALSDRVGRLEAGQRHAASAASAALAAAALAQAAEGAQPFAAEVAAVEPLLPPDADLRALRRLGEAGAPTRATLAVQFPDAAAKAAVAVRARATGDSLGARLLRALSGVVSIRRVDRVSGTGPDAILARAGRKVDDGDLEGALADLSRLPPSGREAVGGWRAAAERRVEIDRAVSAVRAGALRDLTQVARGTAQP